MASVTVSAMFKFVREDGDGTNCLACGDQMWLEMWRLWVMTSLWKRGRWRPLETCVCSNCQEQLEGKRDG
jgi:hypothetical protein